MRRSPEHAFSAGRIGPKGVQLKAMHNPQNTVPESFHALLDKLNGDELIAAHRHLEQVMQERGIEPDILVSLS